MSQQAITACHGWAGDHTTRLLLETAGLLSNGWGLQAGMCLIHCCYRLADKDGARCARSPSPALPVDSIQEGWQLLPLLFSTRCGHGLMTPVVAPYSFELAVQLSTPAMLLLLRC
jgi:hypothetical protein